MGYVFSKTLGLTMLFLVVLLGAQATNPPSSPRQALADGLAAKETIQSTEPLVAFGTHHGGLWTLAPATEGDLIFDWAWDSQSIGADLRSIAIFPHPDGRHDYYAGSAGGGILRLRAGEEAVEWIGPLLPGDTNWQGYGVPALVLSDGPGGLDLVSAPATIPLTVGHVAYLPVEVQGYHRPITVSAQTLIHAYVNDVTPAAPGGSPAFVVGTLTSSQGEIQLQTLRMRAHPLTLTFVAGRDQVSAPITLTPGLQHWMPVFGAGFIPGCPNCYWGALSEPYTYFDNVYGTDCRPCAAQAGKFRPSTPAELECVKSRQQADPTFQCRCRLIRQVFNAEEADRIRTTDALVIQRYASQVLRHQIGWSARQPYPTTITDTYLLEGLDWIFQLPPQERDYFPLINDFMEGIGGWMACPDEYPMVVNTDSGGSIGFYDEGNAALVNEYRRYVRELATRFGPELRFLETMNEPCYSFYLCPCRRQEDQPGYACNQTWLRGPDHQVCDDLPPGYLQPHQTDAFADVYAEFLYDSADIAAKELQAAGSGAILVAGALELSGAGLTTTTARMIEMGLLDNDNVAIMIHQFPYPGAPNWITHEECVYGPGWYLPPGCETAPPFQDYTTPAGRPVAACDNWQAVDEAIDVGEILSDVAALGAQMGQPDALTGSPRLRSGQAAQALLNRFHLFDTELHGGFAIKDETTNGGRTAIAGLRIGAINAHQGFAGLLFTGNNADPQPYNVLVKHLVGVTPVYRPEWNVPLIDTDYAGLVYKLFTRGDEDIIAVWSNAPTPANLQLGLSGAPTQFKQVTLTRVYGPACPTVDCAGLTPEERNRVDVTGQSLGAPLAAIPVQPLQEFYFLSVISDRPGFGWLGNLGASHTIYLPLIVRHR